MSFVGILLVIFMLIVIVAAIVSFFLIRKLNTDEVTDTIVIIRDSSKTGGSCIGNLISKEVGNGGRLKIKFYPRDILNAKPVTIITEANKVNVQPKGLWSKDRNIIEIFPNSAIEFYANMLNKVENLNAENSIILAQREGLSRQQSHLVDMGEGEISRQQISLVKATVDEVSRKTIKDDKIGKPGSYPSYSANRDTFT
jgi:hypothetical protein